jgi:deazaflavin-dependent oxidoreductase (nitroreductase family)
MSEMQDWNNRIIDEFRANNGQVGGQFEGAPMVLITTTGARSGKLRTNPLVYLNDNARVVVFASKAGAPTNPDWYHNLVANPSVTVELGDSKYEATAHEVLGEERDRLYSAQAALMPGFRNYQDATSRVIPVIVLERNS